MNNAPAIADNELIFEPENLTKETIKKFFCPTATDQELLMGLQIAKTCNLNPLKREVYFVKYGEDKMQVLTGYEVYVKRAERSGKYDGLEVKTEGSLKDGNLKGIVKVYRKDWKNPLVHEADYAEYVQMKNIYEKRDGRNVKTGQEPNRFWREKPKTMIKKVAISQGFRLAFPDELDGLPYTSEEANDHPELIDVQHTVTTAPVEQEKPLSGAYMDPNEQKITSEQGTAILAILSKNGWDKKDLKEYISYELELTSIMDIKNKHLLQIKEYFSKPKSSGEVKETKPVTDPSEIVLEQ